jgi:hypothetical protein
MSLKPYTKAFANVWERIRGIRAAQYMFTDERVELALTILALMETAYDEAFAACEGQDSGFAGATAWTNENPYRKDENVLGIIANVQRNLRERVDKGLPLLPDE